LLLMFILFAVYSFAVCRLLLLMFTASDVYCFDFIPFAVYCF
jgi:hypothetical protein